MNRKFDAVAFMRKRRAEIDREDADLTWAEKSKKTCKALQGDPLWERLQDRKTPTGTPLPGGRAVTSRT